jgi:hypothetical protein
MRQKQHPDVIMLLSIILGDAPKLPAAPACASNPRLWDGNTEQDRAEAIALCDTRCPTATFDRCRAWAENAPQNTVHGVVAGRWHEWSVA